MKNILWINLVLILVPVIGYSQRGQYDGVWWKNIETNIEKSTPQLSSTAVQITALQARTYFVDGLLEGLQIEKTTAEMAILIIESMYLNEQTKQSIKNEFRGLGAYTKDYRFVTIDQYVTRLSKFYSDDRNTKIRLRDAMGIVAMEVVGKSTEEIEWQTLFLRADPETQQKMVRNRYPEVFKK